MAELRTYGDPVLRKKSLPVADFNDDIRAFIKELKADLYEYDGVGLASSQIGRNVRIFVIDTSGGESDPLVFVNPELFDLSEEKVENEEGCLSIPDISLKVWRHATVSVRALDEKGNPFTIENANDLLARALQHETDHLDGILFVDRISPLQRKLIDGKLKKMARSRLE